MAELNYYDELSTSLKEALDYQSGKPVRCRVDVRIISVPEYDGTAIAQLRRRLNLSQKALASAVGVSTRTVEAWEMGRNTPSDTAQHLLYLFDQDDSLVDRFITRQ